MKKIISIISFMLCFALAGSNVFASNISNTANFENSNSTFEIIWTSLKENGKLTVGEDGLLDVTDENEFENAEGYSEFLRIVAVCNDSIKQGILAVNTETVELYTPDYIECSKLLDEVEKYYDNSLAEQYVIPRNGAHGCSYSALNLLNLCERNYQTIVSYLADMQEAAITNPNLDPYSGTVAFWVGKVRPNGAWDYKTLASYQGTFCSYFDGSFNHVTGEYIGNFNYGYTGSYLFTLNVLIGGSIAAAGFSVEKDEHDWPAIRAGYNQK